MSDDRDETIDDAQLTKPKKPRSEAQIAAFENMRKAREEKIETKKGLTADEKKLRLKAIREQLNGPLKKDMPPKAELKPKPVPEPDPEPEEDDDEEPEPIPVKPKKKEVKVVSKPKTKKEPKVIYETESESEEEVIVVKKKKKPKRKTIIYEDATESEEEVVTKRSVPVEPVRKERDTKTQQNVSTKFKVTPGIAEKPKAPATLYYFAD
jgi:hypothetical protein